MSSCQISADIYSVGILNPNMRIFDVIMTTEYGTSYNSFVVRGKEKTALIEASHTKFYEQYLDNIREVCALEEIDYIILNHCEPDHSGVLAELLKHCPRARVVVSRAGSIYLKGITNNPALDMLVVKDGDTLDLGGRELSFINAPFLHWPDSMFTWSPQDKTLFSCDFLGCHFCEPYTFDYNIVYNREYELALRVYFDAIFAPFKPYVVSGLDKIRDLDLETVCTSHGPVLTKNCRLSYALEKYIQWSAPLPAGPKLIPVFYCSAYGNTGKIAEAIQSGILHVLPEANCEIFDLNYQDMGEMQALLARSSAFAVGSPTINADAVAPIWHLLSHVDAINNRKRPALVFGSYGWSGEAVPNLTARLAGLKTAVFGEGFKVNFVPSSDDLEKARELGSAFAASLRAESK